MANILAPKGFSPTRHLAGGIPGRHNQYLIPSGHAENIFAGDLVQSDGNGGIQLATAASAILGVFKGVAFVDPAGSTRYSSSWTSGQTVLTNTQAIADVNDDPLTTLVVQTVGSLAAAEVGQLVNLDTSQAGNTSYGRSGQMVTGATGAENQFRVMRVMEFPERRSDGTISMTESGTNSWVEVSHANHESFRAMVAPSSLEQ